ncbi:hypothetical protein EMCRGX_G002637 [Ephydatia muelleri]
MYLFRRPFLRPSITPFIISVAGDESARAHFVSFPQNACNLFSETISELYSKLVSHLSFENDFILSTQDAVSKLSCVDSAIKEYIHAAIENAIETALPADDEATNSVREKNGNKEEEKDDEKEEEEEKK